VVSSYQVRSSSESLLLTKIADSTICFSPLKFAYDSKNIQEPNKNSSELIKTKARNNFNGVVQGADYRGVEVLADIKKLDNVPWYLITKIDLAEVFGPAKENTLYNIIIFGLLIFAGGFALLYYHSRLNLSHIKKMHAAENKLSEILENSTNTFFSHTPDNVLTYISPQSVNILGYSPDELIEDWRKQLTDNPINLKGVELSKKAVLTGKPQASYELELRKKDGSLIWAEVHEAPVVKNGKTVAIVGSLTDITLRKSAEKALNQSEKIFRHLLENSPIYIFFKDENFRLINMSKNYEELIGMPISEMLGKTTWELFQPEYSSVIIEEDKRVLFSDELISVEEEFAGRFFSTYKFPIQIEENRKIVAGYSIDITDQKTNEDALIESEVHFRNLADSGQALIWSTGINKKGNYFNKNWLDFTGRSFEIELNDGWLQNIHPEDLQLYQTTFDEAFEKQEKFSIDHRFRRSDGEFRWIKNNGSPRYNSRDEFIGYIGHCLDITELKQTEAELKEVNLMFRLAIEGANLGIWDHHITEGKIIRSGKWAEMLGYDPSEIDNDIESWKKLIHPDDRQLVEDAVMYHREGLTAEFKIEHRLRFKSGEYKWVLAWGKISMRDKNNKPLRLTGIHLNIDNRKKTLQDLAKSEERYKNLFNNHSAVKLIIDPIDGSIVDANKAASDFYGWSCAQLKSMSIYDINALSPKEIRNALDRAEKQKNVQFEYPHRLSNGSTRIVEIFSSKIILDGKTYLHSIIHDITTKKEAENYVKLLGRSIEQSPVSVIITDPSGNIQFVNSKFCEASGYTPAEVLGGTPKILKSGSQSKEFYQELWDTILSGNNWSGELHNKKKNGELFWESVIISSILDENGKITNFVAVKEDITEKKKITNELIISKERAEESSRLKSSFLANMSHELRTPMVGILGFTEIFKSEVKDPQLLEMIEGISSSSRRLMETLNSILDLSRIEAEKYSISNSGFYINDFINDEIRLFKSTAEIKNLSISFIPIDQEFMVYSDKNILHTVISNLIKNALKFTHDGGITITCKKNKIETEDFISISIRDTGIGIPPESLDIIFDEFRQASEGLSRNYEGTGLGLSIAKKLINALDGNITVHSEQGKGSTFIISVPVHINDGSLITRVFSKAKIHEDIHPVERKPRILYVEDDTISIKILKFYLKDLIRVDSVCDINRAVEMSLKNKYDIFLIDINLGHENNGKGLLKILKSRTETSSVPAIAVTAHALKYDKEKFLAEGFDDYISKPYLKNQMISVLKKHLHSFKNEEKLN
jgi:PAS domain S-box-containing protein